MIALYAPFQWRQTEVPGGIYISAIGRDLYGFISMKVVMLVFKLRNEVDSMACEAHDPPAYRTRRMASGISQAKPIPQTQTVGEEGIGIVLIPLRGLIGRFGSWMAQLAGVDVVIAAADRDWIWLVRHARPRLITREYQGV